MGKKKDDDERRRRQLVTNDIAINYDAVMILVLATVGAHAGENTERRKG